MSTGMRLSTANGDDPVNRARQRYSHELAVYTFQRYRIARESAEVKEKNRTNGTRSNGVGLEDNNSARPQLGRFLICGDRFSDVDGATGTGGESESDGQSTTRLEHQAREGEKDVATPRTSADGLDTRGRARTVRGLRGLQHEESDVGPGESVEFNFALC